MDPILCALLDETRRRLGHASPGPITVLIDGRSGSGKSTLAHALCNDWPRERAVILVRLDDLYPGWDGLRSGADAVTRDLLIPRSAGAEARWQEWDWGRSAPAARHSVPAGSDVVIEGCGSLSEASVAHAQLSLWIDGDRSVRHRRALARDGETYAPFWESWAAQEEAHIAQNNPSALADLAAWVSD